MLRVEPAARRRPRSAWAMSVGTVELASETGDDSLSAVTFDSDFETKTKRKVFHKPPPTSPKSPYYSKPRKVASWRSLRTAGGMPLNSRMSLTPQKLWLGAPKQGHVPGTFVYREKEDMYDEIIELKKSLHMQKSDVDLMRTKLRRLEEENSRKDRQIEQLLDPGRGTDFVRTLAEKRPDTGWEGTRQVELQWEAVPEVVALCQQVITGLKQRIFRLEQQCKEKDCTINKLQTDMKTTNLEEMRIAMETYYEEIHRLQTLLASSEATGKKPPIEKKLGMKRQKKMSSALLNLTRSVQELTEENQSLKEDLDRVLSNSPTISKIKGYVDWSKPRLLRRVAELEKKINSMENPKLPTSELGKLNPLAPSSSNISVNLQSRGDQPKDQECLQGALKSLKGELSMLQAQLLEKEAEVKQLLQAKAELEKELETAREGEKWRQEQEQTFKEEIEALNKKCQELEEAKRQERHSPVAVTHEAFGELRTPLPFSEPSQPNSQLDSSSSSSSEGVSRPTTPCSDGRREAAARTLQARWKAHRHRKREATLDGAANVLQAAFRGHLARVKLLSSKAPASRSSHVPSLSDQPQSSPTPCIPSPVDQTEGNPEQEKAVTLIQSVLRGHLARAKLSALREGTVTALTQREASTASHPETTSLPSLEASSGKEDSEVSSGEAAEDQDEAEEPASPQPLSAEPSPSGQQPSEPPPAEDINSDDSDDIIIPPCLPKKKNPSPF